MDLFIQDIPQVTSGIIPCTLTRKSPRWFVITHPRGSAVNTSQLGVSWKLCLYCTKLFNLFYLDTSIYFVCTLDQVGNDALVQSLVFWVYWNKCSLLLRRKSVECSMRKLSFCLPASGCYIVSHWLPSISWWTRQSEWSLIAMNSFTASGYCILLHCNQISFTTFTGHFSQRIIFVMWGLSQLRSLVGSDWTL